MFWFFHTSPHPPTRSCNTRSLNLYIYSNTNPFLSLPHVFRRVQWESNVEFENEVLVMTFFHTQSQLNYHRTKTSFFWYKVIPLNCWMCFFGMRIALILFFGGPISVLFVGDPCFRESCKISAGQATGRDIYYWVSGVVLSRVRIVLVFSWWCDEKKLPFYF